MNKNTRLACPLLIFIAACGGDATPTEEVFKVIGNFTATALPTCAYEVGDIQDHFELEVRTQDMMTYVVANPINAATTETNGTIRPLLTGSYTASGAFELQTVTGGQVYGQNGTLAVAVQGNSTSRTCTWTPPVGPATTVPSVTLGTTFVFQFMPDQIGGSPVTLPPVALPGSTGVWTLTVQKL